MLYIGADHAGFYLKKELKKELKKLGYQYEDLGNKELDPQDDYPDFALAVGKKAAETNGKGILICATGLGMAIVANKVIGVRAAVCWDDFTALQSREHNDTNVLCLAGKALDIETAKKITCLWLEAEFNGEERHKRRLEKIKEIEKGTVPRREGQSPYPQIIPTIIAKDFQELQKKIRQVEPYVEWAHLDVMDGNFVDNKTWPYTEPGKNNPSDLKNLESNLKLEAHLMVEKPENVIDGWIESGVRRIIVHCEATEKLGEIVKKIQAAGLEAGIAINPETPATVLEPFLNVPYILIMTVHPGRGGQEFLRETLGKISVLRKKYKNVKIEVDGGINLETSGKVIQAGANILAVGSAIFKSEDIKKTIEQLKLT